MNPAQLQQHLHHLRLFKSRERLEALLQEAAASELSYADFLDRLLSEEVASKAACPQGDAQRQEHRHAHQPGPLPLRQGLG